MANISSDVLDDVFATDGDTAFTGGQQSAANESSIPAGGFSYAQNMDFDPFGRLNTRRGARTTTGNLEQGNWDTIATNWNADTNLFGSSLSGTSIDSCYYFSTYASQYILIAQGGGILQGTASSAYAAVSGSSYTGNTVYWGQLNNRVYYCDGSSALKYIDSSLNNSSVVAGHVSSITVTNQGNGYTAVPTLTFSSGTAAATATLGYGGRVVAYAVTTQGSGYSATTPPTVTLTAAPSTGITAEGRVNISQTPSQPRYLTSFLSRLFCSTADSTIPPDTIYASDFLDGESWDLAGSSVRVGGDGDPVTGIYPWYGFNLLVFKQRSIWSINADPSVAPKNWVISLINNRIGCVSHRSIQAVGSDIYFLAQDGVRALSQIQSGSQTDVGQPLSAPIQDQIDIINKAALSTVCSLYYRNRYFLSVPQNAATVPSATLVWHQLSQSWCGVWTNWMPRDYCVTAFSGNLRMNFADSNGKLWTWDDYTSPNAETSTQYQDDVTIYESYLISRAYTLGEPLVNKLGHVLFMFTENRLTDTSVTDYLSYSPDVSGTFTSMDSNIVVLSGDKQRRANYNLLDKGKFNVIQFKFGALKWKCTVSGIQVTGFPDNIIPEIKS